MLTKDINMLTKLLERNLALRVVEVLSIGKYIMFKVKSESSIYVAKVAKPCIESSKRECTEFIKHMALEYENYKTISSKYIARIIGLYMIENIPVVLREYIESTLSDVLLKAGKLDEHQIAMVSIKISQALNDIHRAHFVYTDLKPENIGVDLRTNNVKLIDLDSLTRPFTRPRLISYDYAPPEYLSSGIVVKESDLYQLGLIIQYMATGRFVNPVFGEHINYDSIPERLRDIVKELLNPIPFMRLKPEEVMERLMQLYSIDINLSPCL